MTRPKRMGGMKLGDFGSSAPTDELKVVQPKAPTSVSKPQQRHSEKLTTVNIKIRQDQREWMDQTARLVRDNNNEPVPAHERTYPQHLIQIAIDLLKSADVDWGQVRNVEELKEQLKLSDD